jgi:hypothetical protein
MTTTKAKAKSSSTRIPLVTRYDVANPASSGAGLAMGLAYFGAACFSNANTAPKAACAGGRGFETGQKTGAILENSRLSDSTKAARRRPLNRGCEKTRVMVGSWRMTAHNWPPSGESKRYAPCGIVFNRKIIHPQPPRHTPTLPIPAVRLRPSE